ncbi:glycoside hydrolase family 47 protein [Lyophyllum atratum]|nr:glycoside hydrolase family 47 protein [Lyophyllum atratum]
MVSFRSLALGALLSPSLVYGGLVQKPGLSLPSGSQQNRDAVVEIFTISYEAYRTHAFGHDDLLPLSNKSDDSRNGWGATIVDAMSTMHIMGLDNYFAEAVDFASKIDFSSAKNGASVSVFETTIRYLGGLLSAYELSDRKYPALLNKAKEVADKMAFAWVGGNDVPYGHMNFATNAPDPASSNIAEAGTLTMEWATLSKYTGNDTYRQLSEKSVRRIANQAAYVSLGLPAQGIDPATGKAVGGYVTWGGGSDSYFEYLIKYARLNNSADSFFADEWNLAVDSSIKNLLRTSKTKRDIFTYLADYDDSKRIRHVGSHLACFHGGNWILSGGRLLNNQTIVDIGLALADACWNTYASTHTGIGPEVFAYTSADGGYTGPGGEGPGLTQRLFNSEHGFYITAADYILRPEVLESNFYAWRITGDIKYLKRAKSAVDSFNQYLRASGAFAGLEDVNNRSSDMIDNMESFWFAEVLKYLYLTFDDPEHISLDEYVFNTEAHPFKLPPAKARYGTGPPTRTSPSPAFHVQDGKTPEVSQSRGLPISLKEILQLPNLLALLDLNR